MQITVEPPPPIAVTPVVTEVDLLDVLFIALISFAAFLLIGTIAAVIFMGTHHGQPLDPKQLSTNVFFILPLEFASYAVIFAFMALLVGVRHHALLFQAIHWNMPSRRNAMFAIMVGVGATFISEIGELVLNRWIPKSLPMTELFKDRSSTFLIAGFAVLVAPFMEEMLFRGFLYPALARWTGAIPSIIVTASLFTLLHGSQLGYSWAALVPIFFIGMVLTIARAVTKSVATGVLIHTTYNFVLMAQFFIATHGFTQMQGL
ncbi:MAG TPA: CPBP family intramembrane glutamic endopeptidase [Candidatus Angelobacter sp.]|nr:CPBP family intramembrane glutamic endopeptidase [Candidatus Angelobacter sp.]